MFIDFVGDGLHGNDVDKAVNSITSLYYLRESRQNDIQAKLGENRVAIGTIREKLLEYLNELDKFESLIYELEQKHMGPGPYSFILSVSTIDQSIRALFSLQVSLQELEAIFSLSAYETGKISSFTDHLLFKMNIIDDAISQSKNRFDEAEKLLQERIKTFEHNKAYLEEMLNDALKNTIISGPSFDPLF